MDTVTPTTIGSTTQGPSMAIGIAILIVLAIFITAVIIGFIVSNRSHNTSQISTDTGEFLFPCTTTPCMSSLVCDPTSFLCKFGVGVTCSDFSDCVTGLICSGRCATGATGGLNQLCPCDPGFLCIEQFDGLRVCKGAGGTTCQSPSDCASGDCLSNGICATGSPNSFPCTMNIQCASLNCNNGFCQNSGFISGNLGAACAGACVTFQGAGCSGNSLQPLACECVLGTGVPGVCVTADQGILSVCSLSRVCSDQLVCFDQQAGICGSGDTGCFCGFPYTDPNIISPGIVCIEGMSTRGSACFNNRGLGCDIGGQCVNSACGGGSVLAIYRFERPDFVVLGNKFVSATTTALLGITGPSGAIKPYKMFGTSSGFVDTIYLVDHLQGFWSFQYNTLNLTVVQPWTQLIPLTTTTTIGNVTSSRTLLDVGYNGSNFLVAFDETVSGGVTGRNDTVYMGPNPTSLTPFNFQSGSGITGTQYDVNGIPLSIDYIDISPPNDVSTGNDALISFNGTISLKPSAQPRYSIGIIQGGPRNGQPMVGTTGRAQFYFDIIENANGTGPKVCPLVGESNDNPIQCPSIDNVAFVAPFVGFGGGAFDQVLQFSGNIAGVAEPTDRFSETSTSEVQYHVFDYSIFSPSPTGMVQASVIMLTSAFLQGAFIDNIVNTSQGGNTTPLPYRISTTSRSVATNNAFYVLSIGSCI